MQNFLITYAEMWIGTWGNILYTGTQLGEENVRLPKLIDNDLSFAPAHNAQETKETALKKSRLTMHMVRKPPALIDHKAKEALSKLTLSNLVQLANRHNLPDADLVALVERRNALMQAAEDDSRVVAKWDDHSYQRAIKEQESYVQKAQSARKESVAQILAGKPEHAVNAIATLLPIEGGEMIGELLSRLPYHNDNEGQSSIQTVLELFIKKIPHH